MAKKTIAELRREEVIKLATMHNPDPTEEDIATARKLMNSFYRLCGLAETNLYWMNNEDTCNTSWAKASEARELNWHKRLSKEFEDFAGLTLEYCGYAPSIGKVNEHRGFSEKIERHFYK